MNSQNSKGEIFDVFLCHNSEDKPAVREIADQLVTEGIKPWLDEREIRPGTSWQTALEKQIESIKSAAIFVGESGVGPWQRPEIQAFLNQFVKRECAVIPVVLDSIKTAPRLPLMLENLEWVDFRVRDSLPLQRLIWGIIGEKPAELSRVPSSQKPAAQGELGNFNLLPSGNAEAKTHEPRSVSPKASEARLYPPLGQTPEQDLAAQLEILRRRVKEFWVDGLLKHSLYNEVLISLGKRQIDEAVNAPWKYRVEVSDAVSAGPLADRDVNAIYDATGLLLILGEPGSGKTTTLLDLARTLLDRARDDIKERVPIVLNLSSWKKKQLLADWISGELSEKYRVPRKIARLWLEREYLLLLLDGLDEVEIALQPDCVTAINAFIQESNPSGLVVCSRLNEYRWLPERLKLNGAICLEPLSSEEVSKYLAAGGSKLAALREAIASEAVLQELAQTPLMLSIMSLAYQGAETREFALQQGDSPEERRKQIFRLYVEKMLQRKGTPSLAFPKEKVIGWLSWLAGKMKEHSKSVFLVEGLQPSWLGTRTERGAYGAVVALGLGLFTGLTSGLIGTLNIGPLDGLIAGLFAGFAILVGIGLGCWSKSPLKNGVMSGLIGWLTGGSILGVNLWWINEQIFDLGRELIVGLIYGLMAGLAVGSIGGLGVGSLKYVTSVETLSWKWNQFWKRTIPGSTVGLSFGLFLGLISGFLYGERRYPLLTGSESEFVLPQTFIVTGLIVGLKGGLTFGLAAGLIGGLISGLVGGFTDRVKVGKAFPNQGISLSWKNALDAFLVTLAVGLLVGLLVGLIDWLNYEMIGRLIRGLLGGLVARMGTGSIAGLVVGLMVGLAAGLVGALIVGLNRGGSAVIKHYALRLILRRKGYMPLNFIKFLDHCAKLILLKKVGGGYIFIHRMLLEYFADLPAIERSGESKRT